MSIKLMSKVFEGRFDWGKGAPAEPTVKLVLLALADHASDTGEAVYPSIAHMCAKTGLMRRSVCSVLAAARKRGILTAIGKRRQVIEYRMQIVENQGPDWNQVAERTSAPDARVPVHNVHTSSAPDAHVIINEPSTESPMGADAHALTPSGEGSEAPSPRRRRDPFEIEADFEARRAQGRVAGRDQAAAAHPLAGRWPHLVELARSFEDANGTRLADLPKSQVPLWAKQLEGHYQADLTPDDERELVRLAKAKKWDLYSPGSADKLIGHLRRQSPTLTEPTYAKPSF